MEHKIVIADCDLDNIDAELAIFRENGFGCDWRNCIMEDEVIAGCGDATVLIVQYAKLSRRAIAALPKLQLIVCYGTGTDTVDLEAAREHGIRVCNVPDYCTNEVADQAAAHTLSLQRKLYQANIDVRQGRWNYADTMPVRRLGALVVGVIGFGRIGKAYAKRMHAFGASILATASRSQEIPDYVTVVHLDDLLRQSDIISIHCPGDGNENLIGDREFSMMKDGAYLINVSRGIIIDEAALDRALVSGKLAGCGLDVVREEPLPAGHFLLRHSNLTISPHSGWYSEESEQELKRKATEEVLRFIKGEPVHHPVV